MDNNISQIRKVAEYWVSMVQEPQRKIQDIWKESEKIWEKINREMKRIELPEFGPPEYFIDFHDIVKRHTEKNSAWEAKVSKISSMTLGQVKKFMECPNKSLVVLRTKYQYNIEKPQNKYSTP
jgi:hypothetical protein